MARARMLSTEASTDPHLNALTREARELYLLSIPHLDRDGLISGHPRILWAAAAPLQTDLMDLAPQLIQEWVDQGLVIRYGQKLRDGPVLFFKGFRKHNSGLEYGREAASRWPPPPGFIRGEHGLLPEDEEESFRLAQHFHPRSSYHQELVEHCNHIRRQIESGSDPLDELIEDASRTTREQLAKSSRGGRAEDQDQVQDQDQDQAPIGGGVEEDPENDGGDDDEEEESPLWILVRELRNPEQEPMLQSWALERMQAMKWSHRATYYKDLSIEDRAALVGWLWLQFFRPDPERSLPYGGGRWDNISWELRGLEDPFEEITNPAGWIRWNIAQEHPPELHPEEIQLLLDEIFATEEGYEP